MKEFGLIIKLAVSMILIMAFGEYIPEEIQRTFFTISLFLKDALVFLMPLIVFAFIFSCLSSFQKQASLLIVMILTFVTFSNFIFVQLGYFAGDFCLPCLGYHAANAVQQAAGNAAPLASYFVLPFPTLISTDMALVLGTVCGLYGAFWGNEKLVTWGESLKNAVQWGLTNIFIPLVPLYIIGFLFKIHHDDSLMTMFAGYGPMIGLVILVQALAILFFFFVAALGNLKSMQGALRNVLPSGLVALSTMSSVATLPLTLEAAEKNTQNKSLSQLMISATINIHHVGASVGIPIIMAVVMAMNGVEAMHYGTFLVFSLYYMIAKFGVVSVPGGEVIVLLPLLEAHFGFTDTMSGLLTTLNILIDPTVTVANVLCNGALAIFTDKICGRALMRSVISD